MPIDKTQEVLYEMFTTNTGKHLLDSGDAYGRHWELNQQKTIQDFLSQPEIYLDSGDPIINLFQFFRNRLVFSPKYQARFEKYCEMYPEEHYLDVLHLAADKHNAWEITSRDNIYNHDNPFSQCFIWTNIAGDEDTRLGEYAEELVAIELHQGCDVRGGYTKPYFFRPNRPYWLYTNYWIYCENSHSWREDGSPDHYPDSEHCDDDTSWWGFEREQQQKILDNLCPLCGSPLHVELFENDY